MAHDPDVRAEAVALRSTLGLTIDEIAERLDVSRTTVYSWVREISIDRTLRQRESQHRAATAVGALWRVRREESYRQGVEEFTRLCATPTFRDFVCMYVGEGSKRHRNRVALCNSDPAVVALADRWIGRFARKPRFYGLQYHADQDPEALRAFWGETLGIAAGRITVQRKSNSNGLAGRKWRSRHGVLTVGANDTLLRARLQGWIDCLEHEWTRV